MPDPSPNASAIHRAALALPQDQREGFLGRACAGEPALRAEVEGLLAGPGSIGLAPTSGATGATSSSNSSDHSTIGPYHILSILGHGGMGVVYLAEQREHVRRRVALKVIQPGMDGRGVLARFQAERQALAVMDHPNVARVFDAGTTEHGRPYFVMELVRGEPITTYAQRRRLDTRQRLELFLPVCEAVQHAHAKGIIHRDLKPSNILVEEVDGRAVPKVIDFGVAKALGAPLSEDTLITERGAVVGTLEYMSPEQADRGGIDIDTRSDIYSLGVILYELFTGLLPLDSERLRSRGLAEAQRVIRETDPLRPSTRIASLLDHPEPADDATHGATPRSSSGLRALARRLRGDLDWIVMKCLDKDRARRYETAHALEADLRRYLACEPVSAGPPSAVYRIGKFARRHRAPVAAAAFALLALIAGLGTSLWAMRQAQAQRDRARTETAKADQIARFHQDILAGVDPHIARDMDKTLLRTILDRAAQRIATELAGQPEVEAAVRQTIGATYAAAGDYGLAEPHLTESRRLYIQQQGEWGTQSQLAAARLAGLWVTMGRFDQAEPLYDSLLAARKRLLGPDDPLTLSTETDLAAMYMTQWRLDEAEPLLLRTLEAKRRVLGEDDEHTAKALHNLGLTYSMRGRFAEAEPLLVEAVEKARARSGPTHPDTLSGLMNLAALYHSMDRYDQAERVYADALPLCRRVLGDDHRDTLGIEHNLANLYLSQGRNEESEALARRTLAARRRVLGAEHPDTILSMLALAAALGPLDRSTEAEPLMAECLEISRRINGPDHPDTLAVVAQLAMTLHSLGRPAESASLYEQALPGQRQAMGDAHPDTLVIIGNLATLYQDLGRMTDAEPLYRECLRGRIEALGAGHTHTLLAEWNLAQFLCAAKRYDEAEQIALPLYDRCAPDPAAADRATETVHTLVEIYQGWDKPDLAARWQARLAPAVTEVDQTH